MSEYIPENSPYCVRKFGKLLYAPGSPTWDTFQADDTTPNILPFSRRGTGKSWNTRWKMHRNAMRWPGYRYLVVRNSRPELERTHLQYLPGEMESLGGAYGAVKGQADYENGSSGIFTGFEREADALKLIGADLDALVVEEITTMRWGLVVDLASSLRATIKSGITPQLIAPTNPYGPYSQPVKRHWIDQDITQEEEPGYDPADWLALRLTSDDNRHVNFAAYDKRLGPLQLQKRKAWLLGEWSTAEGSYFDDFAPEKDDRPWHVITDLPDLKHATLYRALDWGFSPDPCAVLWIALLPSGRLIVFRERTYLRTPAAEVAAEVIGSSKEMRIMETFVDPTVFNGARAGAVTIGDIMEQSGLPLTASVNDRTAAGYTIHEMLCTVLADGLPKIQFWREGCPNLIRTLPLMQGHALHPDRLADGEDHYVLALGYFGQGAGPLIKGVPVAGPTSPQKWLQPKPGVTGALGRESVKRP